MWGLIDNEFPEDDYSDIIADDEQSNEMPAHPGSLEHSEQPFHYWSSGLHPVHLWDSLDCGRYSFNYVAGSGQPSRCILCHQNPHSKGFQISQRARLSSLSFQNTFNSSGPEVCCSFIFWQTFLAEGPNGRHLALVLRVSEPSVSQITGWHIRIREGLARKIAIQVTKGLAYLHSKGVCHGNPTS